MSVWFPVFGVHHDLIGHVEADQQTCGDSVWPKAHALAASQWQVPLEDVRPVGVKLNTPHQVLLDLSASSNTPVQQLAGQSAEWQVEVAPPASAPPSVMERVFARLEQLEQSNTQLKQSTTQLTARCEQYDTHLFFPVCIRHLLLQAAAKINALDGNRHPQHVPPLTTAAPPWVQSWFDRQHSPQLQRQDLTVIYATSPGTARGDANEAVHNTRVEDQAAAVRSCADEQRRASLARIFEFVHGKAVSGM